MNKIRFDEKIVMMILVLIMFIQVILLFVKNYSRGGNLLYCEQYFTQDYNNEKEHFDIDINKGNLNELVKLEGVGPKIAEKIIEYRTQNGEFHSKDELINIKGINSKKLEVIKDKIKI